jgi:CTP:phosphocholine cytidylyltransferase-like protein/thiamine kinase-like enzyme
MNKQQKDILNILVQEAYINQRALSEQSGYSLGAVNKSIKLLIEEGYLEEQMIPTEKAILQFENNRPKNAIILAAGFGMRMVPINMETPKGLLEVKGETLIERIISQLHEVGVTNIYIVVGFMKEQYEYLIDKYGVNLVVNSDYSTKNNLYSVKRVLKHLSNSYVIPCDIWCAKNPFSRSELYSWYMVTDKVDYDSTVRVNRKNELVSVSNEKGGNAMIGISYLAEQEATIVRDNVLQLCSDSRHDGDFWENALYNRDRMIVMAKVMSNSDVVEINTYEQLRELDSNSSKLQIDAISIICDALKVDAGEITDITVLKKGMTNRSFLFKCKDKKYIMRIPGEGTEQLINRTEEAEVYMQIAKEDICDNIIYMNPQNGYKITEYMENARTCDPFDEADLQKSMRVLRNFHEKGLKVEHEFDIFKQIDFYESLWEGEPSVFKDYKETKQRVFSLRNHIEMYNSKKVLTHIDAVPDNFLFVKTSNGEEDIRLIDWEYAGMQDPHVDIAMFCIYAMYDREQVEQLIDCYFVEGCPREIRIKIYCYIAACGLLWSNWCEYKRNLGVEFDEYSLRQYRYAKDYYKLVQEEWKKEEERQ